MLFNADGQIDTGYAWRYDGVQSPYYGAFAEQYSGEVRICSAVFDFSTFPDKQGASTMDVYVWDDDDGVPGAVVFMKTAVDPGPVSLWPNFSRHAVLLDDVPCLESTWWIGYWGDWPGEIAAWAIGADLDGGMGRPKTNVAPGLGFPTGWQNPSVAWGPTHALYIGAEVLDCGPTPTSRSSWGQIKSTYLR